MKVAAPLAERVMYFATSPDGDRVALAQPDGRVHVRDLPSGRDVCELEGPGSARALAWVSADHVLVAREAQAGRVALTTHVVPDGGAVGEREVPHDARHPFNVQTSLDGARGLVVHRAATEREYVLAMPSLDVVAELDLTAIAGAVGARSLDRETLTLHPDGHHLACAAQLSQHRAVVALGVARPEDARIVGRFNTWCDQLRWMGPRRLALRGGLRPLTHGLMVIECDDALARGVTRRKLGGDNKLVVDVLDVHPDGERALVATHRSPPGSLNLSGWDAADAVVSRVEVIHCASGERLDLGEFRPWGVRPRFVADGAIAVFIAADLRGTALAVADLATGRRGLRAIGAPGPSARPVEIQGGRVVTLATRRAEGVLPPELVPRDELLTLEFVSRDELFAIANGSP